MKRELPKQAKGPEELKRAAEYARTYYQSHRDAISEQRRRTRLAKIEMNNAKEREWLHRLGESLRERNGRHAAKHAQRMAKVRRAYADSEARRSHRQTQAQADMERARKYYHEHREEVLEKARQRYHAHREEIAAQRRAYRDAHPGKVAEYNRKARRKRAAAARAAAQKAAGGVGGQPV